MKKFQEDINTILGDTVEQNLKSLIQIFQDIQNPIELLVNIARFQNEPKGFDYKNYTNTSFDSLNEDLYKYASPKNSNIELDSFKKKHAKHNIYPMQKGAY